MLEIKVFDETLVTDSFLEAIEFIQKVIKKILAGDSDLPVNIAVKRVRSNSPPVLGVNVSEESLVKDRLV